jgi:hypothetical protein
MADPTQPGTGTVLDVTTLSDQISKDPALFSALQVINLGARKLGTTESTAQQHRNHRVISFAAKCIAVETIE